MNGLESFSHKWDRCYSGHPRWFMRGFNIFAVKRILLWWQMLVTILVISPNDPKDSSGDKLWKRVIDTKSTDMQRLEDMCDHMRTKCKQDCNMVGCKKIINEDVWNWHTMKCLIQLPKVWDHWGHIAGKKRKYSCWLIEAEQRIYVSVSEPSLVQIKACRRVSTKP